MKKMILTVDDQFPQSHFIDMEELKFFKDIPIEIITKSMLKGLEMELNKKDLRKKEIDKIPAEEKEKFINDYCSNKALLTMFALSNSVSDVKFENID